MTTLRVTAWLLLAAVLLVSHGLGTATASASNQTSPAGFIWSLPSLAEDAAAILDGGESAPARVDVYGNVIEPAIGDYRVDREGEIYERHAPDTEVTKLGSPGV